MLGVLFFLINGGQQKCLHLALPEIFRFLFYTCRKIQGLEAEMKTDRSAEISLDLMSSVTKELQYIMEGYETWTLMPP